MSEFLTKDQVVDFKLSLHFIILTFVLSLAGCGDAIPKVDFLNSNGDSKKLPEVAGTSNLTPTQEMSGGGYKVRSRVSFVGLQNTLYGTGVKLSGKISQ